MENIDDLIIDYLKDGLSQKQIAGKLKDLNIEPNSLSSVEKKLRTLREIYEAKTLFHLACILHNKKVLKITESRNSE